MPLKFNRRRLQLSAGFAVALTAGAIPVLHRTAPRDGVRMSVDLSQRRLTVYDGGEQVATYSVAIGSAKYPTPTGTYSVQKIVWNPAWVPPNSGWAAGKEPQSPGSAKNPMKLVKIYFKEPDYYIHGTNDPESIGDAASHGCLRMEAGDAANLARLLMDRGGQSKPDSWFTHVYESHDTQTVKLDSPVSLTIGE
jgi:lipoprotein-anchoring transpeptidase ErfK/SrfK